MAGHMLISGSACGGHYAEIRFPKIKSHPTAADILKPQFAELPAGAWKANAYADGLAKAAARHLEVSSRAQTLVQEQIELAANILERIVELIKKREQALKQDEVLGASGLAASSGCPAPVAKAQAPISMVRLLLSSQHKTKPTEMGALWCSRCRSFSPCTGSSDAVAATFRAWVRAPCHPGPSSGHLSHRLVLVEGLGLRCKCRVTGLRQQCPGQVLSAKAGKAAARLSRGLRPEAACTGSGLVVT